LISWSCAGQENFHSTILEVAYLAIYRAVSGCISTAMIVVEALPPQRIALSMIQRMSSV
jgi:hypothetical protein